MEDVEQAGKGVLTKDSQLINIIPQAVLSPNPVQALADKRELDYLNSVRKYQIDIAAREQNYLESVQQQQQAAVQREDAYAEMVLTAAAKLRQEADQRKASAVNCEVLPKLFLDKTAHWRYNTTIFRMNVPGETAHAAPKGKAKSLRQKDRFGTKLWKAYLRTGEAIRPWRRIFRVNGQRHQTLAKAHEDFCPVRFLFCPRSPEQIEEGFVMVQGSVVASSPLLYALIAAGLAMVVVFAVISAVKACRRCAELGIRQEVIQGVIKGTVASAIVPSVAILLGFLTLSVSLGAAWPWWRLSVIGSLSYEVMATQYTANGLGVVLNEIMTSPANVFGAVMMVMTIGIMIEPLAVVLLGKKYSTGIMKAKTGSNEWGQIMSGCFFLAMFAVYLPIMIFSDLPTTLTLVVSLGVTLLCGALSRKAKWLGNFTMAIAMIVAMASSVVWVRLFG